MESNKKQIFVTLLNGFQVAEQEVVAQKEVSDTIKTALKSAGAAMADALYDAIITKEIDAEYMENLPKVSRTCQGYLSKARKVGFAVLAGEFTRPDTMALTTAYDHLQAEKATQKEGNKLLSQRVARENAALLEVLHSQSEVNRVLTENGPELQAALQTGLAIIAEREAKNAAEEKAADMEKLVTETKANLAIIMDSPYWQEMLDYVNQSTNSHKSASAA